MCSSSTAPNLLCTDVRKRLELTADNCARRVGYTECASKKCYSYCTTRCFRT